MGIKDLHKQNTTFGTKLVWRLFSNPEAQRSKILVAKYLDNNDPKRILTIANPRRGSALWNFMLDSRPLITNHLTWLIGDGTRASFWNDSWNGYVPLNSLPGMDEAMWLTRIAYGESISSFVNIQEVRGRLEFNWKDFSMLEREVKKYLEEELVRRKISFSLEPDHISWCVEKSGVYSIRLGYEVLSKEATQGNWSKNLCWGKFVLPKAGAFAWTALHDRILTVDRLYRIDFSRPYRCVLCKNHEETSNHILVECDYAWDCWAHFYKKLNWHSLLPKGIKDIFSSWPQLCKESAMAGLWSEVPTMILWHLWRERNARIFKDKEAPVHKVIGGIEVGISEYFNVKASYRCYSFFSYWDQLMIKKWPLIKYSKGNLMKAKSHRASIKWKLPPKGRLKLNFDGASKGNPGQSGARFVVPDDQGKLIWAASLNLPTGSNNYAKVTRLLAGVKYCVDNNLKGVYTEGNFEIIIQAASTRTTPSWKLKR